LSVLSLNAKFFNDSQKSYWKSKIISLLRANSPEVAKKAEKRYSLDNEESGLADFSELNTSKDTNAVVNKILGKLSKGEMPTDLVGIIEKLREKNPQAVLRILDILLNFYETPANVDESGNDLNFYIYDFLNQLRRKSGKDFYILPSI
jgi:hypothetical protein